jgi:DNA-binding MltR family transcriptional regulator
MPDNEIEKAIGDAVSSLEVKLQIRNGFFDDLFQEDDWSFIIKSHAIIEAAVSTLLTRYLGKEELIDVFARIELSNKSFGKIQFLKCLNILEKEERRFISSLSELRNKLVHNIQEIDFSFSSYINGLKKEQKQNFINNFGYCFLVENKNGERKVDKQDHILSNPKKTIWLSLKYILANLSMQIDTSIYRKDTEMHRNEIERLEQESRSLQMQYLNEILNT